MIRKGQSSARDGAESFHFLGPFQRCRAVSIPSAALHEWMKGTALPDEISELGSAIQVFLSTKAIFFRLQLFSCCPDQS